jgi:hypothetical protein
VISSQERPKGEHIPVGADKPALIERQLESAKLRPASFIGTKGWNSSSLVQTGILRRV